jgi:hypothetical protein
MNSCIFGHMLASSDKFEPNEPIRLLLDSEIETRHPRRHRGVQVLEPHALIHHFLKETGSEKML